MSEGFLRQRRGLIFFSLLLGFMFYAGVEINSLAVLGVNFGAFDNPRAVYDSLWIGWVYFTIRYIQYFFQEGAVSVKRAYVSELDFLSKKTIENYVENRYPKNSIRSYTYSVLKNHGWVFHGQEVVEGMESNPRKIRNFKLPIKRRKFALDIFISFCKIVFVRSVATDFILPFFIGFTPFLGLFFSS